MILHFYAKNQREFRQLDNKRQSIMHFHWYKYQKGFSLIELMVAVVILGLIILALVTFFTGGTKAWVAGQSQLEAQRNARLVMDRMVREIREGKNIHEDSNGTKIIIIYSDNTTKKYEKVNSTLKENSSILINNLIVKDYSVNPIFKYYKNDGSEVTTPSGNDVSKVHIELEVDVDKDSNPDITLNADIKLRNYSSQ
jgi:prepilin-type N-terminal cleavage/methylation domain-containing protein